MAQPVAQPKHCLRQIAQRSVGGALLVTPRVEAVPKMPQLRYDRAGAIFTVVAAQFPTHGISSGPDGPDAFGIDFALYCPRCEDYRASR
jgi:hypothetical protein